MRKNKCFYFVRHGQTDPHTDQRHITLNSEGIRQAEELSVNIQKLDFKTVLCSPLIRARETSKILLKGSSHEGKEIFSENLEECSTAVWKSMTNCAAPGNDSPVGEFHSQVSRALQEIFALSGTPLAIAHGGIHYAICQILSISSHHRMISNCRPVRFFRQDDQWHAENVDFQNGH